MLRNIDEYKKMNFNLSRGELCNVHNEIKIQALIGPTVVRCIFAQ
jgi:hypothetical protein